MDIDLSLPSGEHDKEDEKPHDIVNMLDVAPRQHNGDELNGMVVVGSDLNNRDVTIAGDLMDLKDDMNLEPLAGMEFESHGEAYSFYQEYARSMGFSTAIQNSRRSKTSREFIDAKFACSRYGTKREYEKSNRQRNRPETKLEVGNSAGRRSCSKTDCKACMHVKRRPDGKWIIHRFVKEHNHELLPAQAVSEQTRMMYAAMARQFAEYKTAVGLKNDLNKPFEKGRNSALEGGEAKVLLEFFTQSQTTNSNFFYAVDVTEDQRLKNFLWVDAKSRHDYLNFSDVVSFDTTYVKSKYKMPLALLIGVNQHYQFLLLGCALLADESEATFSWVLRTWLKAMGGQAPKVIITDQDKAITSVILEIFPTTFHQFCLWHILGKVTENFSHIIKLHENFMSKLEKCVYRSWTTEEFEKRWLKLLVRFELQQNEWFRSLYEDRARWAPTYMTEVCFAGMCTAQRSESVNSFLDKYVHKKTTVPEFLKQYEMIIQDRYEEEAKADSDTWNRQPSLKSPSPFEKHASGVYTHAVFRKFQNEVLGAVACHPKQERQDEITVTFRVQDFEKNQDFIVTWNGTKSEVSCICRLFESRGYLCRHAMIVLQMCGLSTIPVPYLLKRWTKDAKNRSLMGEVSDQVQSRMQRYNDLCSRAIKLGEEGSLSQESFNFALRALEDAFGNCVSMNNCNKNLTETGTSGTPGLLCIEDESQRSMAKTNKKKNPTKKRKVNSEQDVVSIGTQDSLQQMDKLSSRPVTLDGYFSQQPNISGIVRLNLMAPTRDSYYGNQQAIQGLGQLSSMAPSHDGYYNTQPSMHGLGQMDFFRSPAGFPYGIREEPSLRSSQLHDDTPRHA